MSKRKKQFMKTAAGRHKATQYSGSKTNSGYSNHGANSFKSSAKGYLVNSQDARHDIDANFRMLRARSVDLQQGTPIAAGALKTNKTNVIGPGLRFKANIRYEELGLTFEEKNAWERKTEREFAMWAKHCDAREQTDFYGIQALTYYEKLLYGDAFVNLPLLFNRTDKNPYPLRLQIVESILVASPPKYIGREEDENNDVIHGVKFNKYGAAVGFYVLNKLYNAFNNDHDYTYIPKYGTQTGRRNIIQVMTIERSGQLRGIPILSPVIEDLKVLSRYNDAEVMKVLVNALMAIFIESEAPDDMSLGTAIDEDDQVDSENDETIELGNGTVNVLAPGEKVNVAEKTPIPTSFADFTSSLISHVGAALEIPYEILVKHFGQSYSASRAALLEYWKSVEMQRAEFITQFCNPIYEEWLTMAILLGRIDAPGFFDDPIIREAWLGAEWYGPSQGQLDPEKEATAAEIRVKNAFSTRAKEAAELTGMDYENEILPQRIREHQSMDEGGLLNEQGQQISVQNSNSAKSDSGSGDD
jgi:phage portal protein, lambda family